MAVTLVVEDGTAKTTANTYASVSDADAYHASRLHVETWQTADVEEKAAALVWATRILDDELQWLGTPTTTTQALRWPRTDIYLDDTEDIDDDEIPTRLVYATAEMARLLIEADRTAMAEEREPSGQSSSRGGASGSISFNASTGRKRMVPEAVRSLVRRYTHRVGTLVRA
jgi:hypothetical protein